MSNTKSIRVISEDETVLVINKPVGVLSEDSGSELGVVGLLSQKYGEIHLLHRLDRNVGGVMVLARTKKAAAKLSEDIRENSFFKEYLAVVAGKPEADSGGYEDLLFKDSQKNRSYVVKRERKGVKKASLEYTVLGYDGERSLVRILLHTGRTHQIRVQFSSRKMCLCGDVKYGSKDRACDIALFSHKLTFTHPDTLQTVSFTADPDFTKYPWNCFSL